MLAAAACTDAPAPIPHRVKEQALVRTALEVTVGAADLQQDDGEVVVQGGWGEGTGQFGKRDEASRPGPMSLAVADDGSLFILDQVNRRVAHHTADGQLLAYLPVTAETTEDIAVDGDDLWTLVFEPGPQAGYRVERYRNGQPDLQLALDRSIQLVTGLFVEHGDVWVEQRHALQRRVVTDGQPGAADQAPLPGRRDRAGRGFRLDALRSGSHQARVHRVTPGQGTELWVRVTTPMPLVAIQELTSDRAGRLYLGLLLVQEGPDHTPVAARKVMLVVQGQSARVVELSAQRATDVFRPVAVGPDGSVYQLQTTEEGVTVRRWRLEGGAS